MPFLAPVFAAIGSVVGAIGATAVGSFALKIGTSLLLSAAASALQKKPSFAASTSSQIAGRDVTIREAVAPCEIVYGRSRKGGVITFLHSVPTPGAETLNELHVVIVLASHQVSQIGNIYFDGELAHPAGSNVAVGRFAGKSYVERANGGADQTAFPGLVGKVPDKWTADHRMRGQAAIWLQLWYDAETYPAGIPNITADVIGKNDILDPRKGIRGYTENAALCVADYMSLTPFGIGAAIGAADGINTADLIASANVCDEDVAVPGGGFEKRYACNGVVSLADDPQTIIEAMLSAMAGSCVYAAGQWSIHAGYYRAPSVTLTADDVREGGLTLITRQSRSQNFNAVRGTFVSPENDWVVDDFPPYVSSTYVAEDGGETTYSDITLPFTISPATAQRLARIELERQRRQMTVDLAGKLNAWRVGAGDTVMLSYSRWGFAAKPFEVAGLSLEIGDGDGGPQVLPVLALRETSPLVYDWNASEAQIYAAAPRTTLPTAFDIEAPGQPSATESLYQTRSGDGVKALALLTWAPSPSAFVAQYQVEGARNGGQFALLGYTDAPSLEVLDIMPGVWLFRVKAISTLRVSSDWATSAPREILGLGAPPVALSNVTVQAAGGLAVLKWTQHPDLDVRQGGVIEIRHSQASAPSWLNAVRLTFVPGITGLAVVDLLPGSYVLRAIDSAGSLGPETIIASSGAQVLPFTAGTTLQEDDDFTGARFGVIVESGALRLDVAGDLDSVSDFDAVANLDALGGVVAGGTYNFAAGMDFGSVKNVRLRRVIVHSVLGLLDNFDTRPGTVDGWPFFDGAGGSEVDVYVECRTTTDDPAGSPTWGPWGRVDNTEVTARGVQARAVLTTLDVGYTPAVEQLRLIAQEAA
jgi:hypothetical protein